MKARRMACNTVRTSHLPCLPGSTEEEEEGADTWESVRTAELGARLPSIPPRRRRRRRAHSGNSESHMCAEAGGGGRKIVSDKRDGVFSAAKNAFVLLQHLSWILEHDEKEGKRAGLLLPPPQPSFFPSSSPSATSRYSGLHTSARRSKKF